MVTLAMLGFWLGEVNPFGPVQLYVTPGVVEVAVKDNVLPAHGLSEVKLRSGLETITVVAADRAGQVPLLIPTVYDPATVAVYD